MTMIHKLIISGICILSLAAFSFVGVAQGASYFQIVTEHAGTETAGKVFSVSLVARDAAGGTDTAYTGSHYIVWDCDAHNSPDGLAPTKPSNGTQTFAEGVVTVGSFTLTNAGTCTLSASDGTISGTSSIIMVKPAMATQFKIAAPSTAMAGTAFSLLYLRACDLYGNVATDYDGPKTLEYSGPGNGSATGIPKYPNPVTFNHGIANLLSKVTLYRAEDTHIKINDAAIRGSSVTITVSPGTPHHFEVTTENNQIEQAGSQFSITLRAMDIYGNLVTDHEGNYLIVATWTATSPDKPLDGTRTFMNGTTTIHGFTLTNATETPTISVTDGMFSGISDKITVIPGTATKFKVTTKHNNIETANTTFRVILTCQDAYENTLINFNDSYSIGWQWTANSPSKPATETCGFTNGVAMIDGFTLTKAGETPIIIAKSTISGTSSPITVNPGDAATFVIKAPAEVNAGQSFLLSPIVAYDSCGNTATSYQGPKTLTYTGAANGPVSGTPNFTTQVNFSNGSSISTLTTTLIRAGTCSLRVDDGKIAGQSGIITVISGNAAIFSLITQHNGTETAGVPFEMNIVASDIFGNFASGYDGERYLTWTLSPNDTRARPPQEGKRFFTSGSITVDGIILYNAQETPVIAVSDGAVRGTSSKIVVVPTDVTHFEMNTQHNQAETAGSTFSVTLTARDSCGNIATNYIGNHNLSWGLIAANSPTGILPVKPADGVQIFDQGRVVVDGFRLTRAEDMATITVTESTITGTVTGTCGSITVRSGSWATFAIVVPLTAEVDLNFEISKITAQDICGNIARDYQGIKTLTYTGPGNSPAGNPPSYTNPVSFAQGVAARLLTKLVKTETVAILVQEGMVSGESAKIEVTPSLTSRFEIITSNNGTETAGQPFSVIIRVIDVSDNLVPGYTGSHRIRWFWNATRSANDSLPSIAQDGTYTFTAGRAEIGGFRLVNADEITAIIARDGSIEGSSKPIIVEPGRPTGFEIKTLSYVKAGEPFNITSITAKDNYGNVAKTYTGDKSLNYSGPGTSSFKNIPGYIRVVNFDKGIATTVLRTTLYKAEKVRIHVEEGGIFGDSMEVEVRGAGEAVFQVNTQHDNEEVAGEAFSVIIRTMDKFGNEVTDYPFVHYLIWSWTATASPDGVMPDRPLNGNAEFNFGVATIPGFRFTNATQTPTISVTDGINVRGTASPIRIKPNKAVSFDIAIPSPVTVNRPFDISKITAKDSYGNIAVSYSGDKILLYTGPKSDAVNGDPGYTYAAHFEAGILTSPLNTILSKEEITSITIREEDVVGTSNGIEVLTMGACFLINPHEVYAHQPAQIMDCHIINNNSAEIYKIQIMIPYGFTFVYRSVPVCSDKNKVWNAEVNGQEVVLSPAKVSDCLLNGESIQIQITVKTQSKEQDSVAWPCLITSGSFTLRAAESKKGDGQVRITAYRLKGDVFPQVILLGGTATVMAQLSTIADNTPYPNGLIEYSLVSGDAVLIGENKVWTNNSGSATINLRAGTSTGTVTVQIKYREYDIKTMNIRIVSNVPKIIPGKDGAIKQGEVIVKPITPITLINEEGFDLKYRIDDGTWTTYTGPFSVGTEGVHTINYACVDKSGNPGPIMSSPLFVVPASFSDVINFPNPFSPDADGWTTIEYHLDSPMDVEIRIYNLFGELVRNMDQSSIVAGIQQVKWDGRNGDGDMVGNGGYICVVRVKGQEKGMKRKILVVK